MLQNSNEDLKGHLDNFSYATFRMFLARYVYCVTVA